MDLNEGMYLEDDKTNPINVYGQSKLGGESVLTIFMGKAYYITSKLGV